MTSENLQKWLEVVATECAILDKPTPSINKKDDVDFLIRLAKFENSKQSRSVVGELEQLYSRMI